jgi:hypothetical protein
LSVMLNATCNEICGHRRYLVERSHPGLATALLFPSEAGTRPVGKAQLNDVWRAAQVKPGPSVS